MRNEYNFLVHFKINMNFDIRNKEIILKPSNLTLNYKYISNLHKLIIYL